VKLIENGELKEFSRRHAEYYRGLLESGASSEPSVHLDNIRTALEWCFGPDGDLAIGIGLAATAVPMFLRMSLLPECHRWSQRAVLALDDAGRGSSQEMSLQASLGISAMQMHGQSETARAALGRSLIIAERRGDVLTQVGLLGMLSMFYVRDGDYKTSLHYARLSQAIEGIAGNSPAMALSNSIFGRALQFVGDHERSRAELEASYQYWSHATHSREVHFGLDHHILVGVGLARNLWLRGYPAQARERIHQTVADAGHKNHPASLGLALSWAPGMFLWLGDLTSAEEHADWLISHAERHSLGPYVGVGRSYKGALAIARGNAASGVETLRICLEHLHQVRYEMLNTGFKLALVQGLIAIAAFDEALALADDVTGLVTTNGDLLHMPEALRVKGNALLSLPQRLHGTAEMCFIQSLDWSRRQGARSWELRASVDLASLWEAQGQRDRARALLQPIFEQFEEGFDTADVKAAEHLLATLR
jgi:hypothetical protein